MRKINFIHCLMVAATIPSILWTRSGRNIKFKHLPGFKPWDRDSIMSIALHCTTAATVLFSCMFGSISDATSAEPYEASDDSEVGLCHGIRLVGM